MKRVVVVGSLNLDRTLRLAEGAAPGRTQTAVGYAEGVGGKGANQAMAAARLGAAVEMVGCVGRDAAGEVLKAALRDAGVGVGAVGECEEPTGTATILVTPDGENTIVLVPGANHALRAEDVAGRRELLAGAGMILVQLETRMEVLAKVVEVAGEAGVPVMLDPAPAAEVPAEVLRGLAWFTPNETEAEFYLRGSGWVGAAPEAEELCRYFQGLGPKNVLLKLGGAGAAMLTENGRFVRVAAPAVTVVDTTGAGDTLNGAFAAELVRGETAEGALRFAVAAASLSTTRDGARGECAAKGQVEEFLSKTEFDIP